MKIFLFLMLYIGLLRPVTAAAKDRFIVYCGTYTQTSSKGIYAFLLDGESGRMTALGLVATLDNPTFLAVHPTGKYLYAVSEIEASGSDTTATVYAFNINAQTAELSLINSASSRGSGPCHLSIDRTGRNVLVANYSSGSVAVLPLSENGALQTASAYSQHHGRSTNANRQSSPHAHSIFISPDNRFALAADLGIDKVMLYRFAAETGQLRPATPPHLNMPAGAGPRHLTFSADGRLVYIINELHSNITACRFNDQTGALTPIQTVSTLPADYQGENTAAEIKLHPNGRFLFSSNRGHNSIACFAVDQATGLLTTMAHSMTMGQTPRNFNLDPGGRFLLVANQSSDSIVQFHVDSATGALTPTDQQFAVAMPVCLVFCSTAFLSAGNKYPYQ